MVHKFKKLTPEELDLLLNATIFVSLLAASSDSEIFEEEKADAIKLAHLRTFTSDPALHEYYKEVEKTFAEKIEDFDKKLPKGSEERGIILREKLNHSLNSYARHVSVSHRNAVEFFFIPMNIDGITNQRKKNN